MPTAQAGQQDSSSRPVRARDELRRLFASYNNNSQSRASTSGSGPLNSNRRRPASNNSTKAKKRKTVKDVTVKFFCLASKAQHDVPTNEEKQELLVAGLGDEFMYAKPSSCDLNVICKGQNGYTIDFLKRFVGQGRVYIRPIQSDLDLNPEASKDQNIQGAIVEEMCNNCFNIFPMNQLRQHIYLCPDKREDKTPKMPRYR